MNGLSSRFDVVENELRTRKEIRTIANEVYEILPNANLAGDLTTLSDGTESRTGTVDWIADGLDETRGTIERALEQLLLDNYNVHEVAPEDGRSVRWFYREDGL